MNDAQTAMRGQVSEMFPDDEAAEKWFEDARWKNGVTCAHCESKNVSEVNHPTMPYRCKDCRKHFSVKTNGLMHASKIGYRKWAIAVCMMTASAEGVTSKQLQQELGITQRSAWYMNRRIREAWVHDFAYRKSMIQ